MLDFPILSVTILIPFLAAIYILAFAKSKKHVQVISLSASALTLVVTLLLLKNFDLQAYDFQFVEQYPLISKIGLDFFLGIDGISLLLINLMAFLGLLCVIYALSEIKHRLAEFMFFFFLLQSFSIASFAALNLLLFYIFFEMALVPMYMIIGLWGGANRIYASYKFFLYTLASSVLFAVCIMYFYKSASTLSIPELYSIGYELDPQAQKWLWWGVFIAFAIKIPMFPFHTWLPDAHVQAPTTASAILAGVLLKLGGYGFLRILLPILPQASKDFAIYPLIMSAVAIIYASFAAISQKDMKKTIAYSSIAHMGFVTGGIFSFNYVGINGGIFQMLSHGLISAALFFIVGSLYARVHTRQIDSCGGLAAKMPAMASFFMIFMLSSIGLPGTSGFIGEFLCLNGLSQQHYFISAISAFGIVLSAVYMLSLYKKVMFGKISNQVIETIADLSLWERFIFTLLAVAIILLGIFPNYVNKLLKPSIEIITEAIYVI
jgi:NADH-quinone oxidoreductase subunit M